MGLFSWIFVGLIAGALGKLLIKEEPAMSWLQTLLLGIIGAGVGGYIGRFLGVGSVTGLNIGSIILATVGSALSLWIYVKYIK
ncbi:Uncharacterized membrane protein YeaQ/YmgE, transglycosylase-associated protein family [Spirosomataceae bacterium TFI 002]|nr:Uncharacterized membrane protein YeaQ/YmgE, transglycosylase-associated protein family [Spirosomataceae bacterium TFI 002]